MNGRAILVAPAIALFSACGGRTGDRNQAMGDGAGPSDDSGAAAGAGADGSSGGVGGTGTGATGGHRAAGCGGASEDFRRVHRVLNSDAMAARVLLLLSVFGAGCLSSALILTAWRADPEDTRSSGKQAVDDPTTDSPVVAQRAVPKLMTSNDAAPIAPAHNEPVPGNPVDDNRQAENAEPPSEAAMDELDASFPTDQGSSVAELLHRLETEYRSVLAAVPANVPAASEEIANVSETPRHDVSTPEQLAVALTERAAPPNEDAPPTTAPGVDAERVAALGDGTRPRDPSAGHVHVGSVHVGDVRQSIHDGDVHQGDVYRYQQDLAILQYFQLLMLSPHAGFAPPAGTSRRVTHRPHSPFSASPNPESLVGFDLSATGLVR